MNVASTLPTPIEFRLPDEWQPAAPDDVGAPTAAFVALVPHSQDGFTANVTIDGELRRDTVPLASLADESIEQLRAAAGPVTVLDRAEVGSAAAPALTQTLRVTTAVNGDQRDLVQAQVYLSMPDSAGPATHAVIRLVLTAGVGQYEAIRPDFQWFVSTVRPDTRAR
jgi:hypothetical protein